MKENMPLENPVFSDLETLLSIKKKVHLLSKAPHIQSTQQTHGSAPSPFRTKGLEFQEVRPYQAGDDVRLIDWRITAKHNKPFTKLYMDERERRIFVICDLSFTMRFASHGVFKSVIASQISAYLSFLFEGKENNLSYVIIDKITNALTKAQTPFIFLNHLVEAQAPILKSDSSPSLAKALSLVDQEAKQGALVFILSDFNMLSDKETHLIERIAQKSRTHLIYIYDILEQELPKGHFSVSDGENIAFLDTTSHQFQENYKNNFTNKIRRLKELSLQENISYLPLKTDSDYVQTFTHYLQISFL